MKDESTLREWQRIEGIVLETSSALALLDNDRLEHAGDSCRTLEGCDFRDIRIPIEGQRAMRHKMACLQRVLEVTRANWNLLRSLQGSPSAQIEYTPQRAPAAPVLSVLHGNH